MIIIIKGFLPNKTQNVKKKKISMFYATNDFAFSRRATHHRLVNHSWGPNFKYLYKFICYKMNKFSRRGLAYFYHRLVGGKTDKYHLFLKYITKHTSFKCPYFETQF